MAKTILLSLATAISFLLLSGCVETAEKVGSGNSGNAKPIAPAVNASASNANSASAANTAGASPSAAINKVTANLNDDSKAPTPGPGVQHSAGAKNTGLRVFDVKGKVTEINMEMGWVGVHHEDIPGLMPAMIMQFNVSDKKMLEGLKIGDPVTFKLEDNNGQQERIIAIKKAEN